MKTKIFTKVTGLQANTWVNGIIEALENPCPTREPCCSCGEKSTMSCVQCDIVLCAFCATQHAQVSKAHILRS